MQTFNGTNTISYPVGVFNVRGKLLGNATTQSGYVTLWMSDTANSNIGTLSTGADSMHFHLALNSGKTPPAAVTGLRYYQFDLAYTNIDGIRNINGAYVDFGDSTGMMLGKTATDTSGLMLPANTTRAMLGTQPYFDHTYPGSSQKTITLYHNDSYNYENSALDNYANPATSLTKVKNLRGYLPQYTNRLGGSCYQDSTMTTVAGIINWNSINTVTFFITNPGDGVSGFLNMRYAQDFMQHSKSLQAIVLSGNGYYSSGMRDSTFKISRLKSDWNTYFTSLNTLEINEEQWNHEDLSSLVNLKTFFWVADNLKHSNVNDGTNPVVPLSATYIDNAINQIAAGAGQYVYNGVINIFAGGTSRTSASDAAVATLEAKGWTFYINVSDH
jgi:hypothetical protein